MKNIEMEVPFFQVPNDIFEIGLNKFELLVYLYLARCANNNEKAYPSLNTIANRTSISRSSVQKAIKGLENRKLIVKKKHKTETNQYYNNTYVVEANLTKDMVSQNTGVFSNGIGMASENIEVYSDTPTIKNYKKNNYKERTNKEYLHNSEEIAYIYFKNLEETDRVKQTNEDIECNRRKIKECNYVKAKEVLNNYDFFILQQYIQQYIKDKKDGRSIENFIEHIKRYEKE